MRTEHQGEDCYSDECWRRRTIHWPESIPGVHGMDREHQHGKTDPHCQGSSRNSAPRTPDKDSPNTKDERSQCDQDRRDEECVDGHGLRQLTKATGPQHLRRSRLMQLRVRVGRPVKHRHREEAPRNLCQYVASVLETCRLRMPSAEANRKCDLPFHRDVPRS